MFPRLPFKFSRLHAGTFALDPIKDILSHLHEIGDDETQGAAAVIGHALLVALDDLEHARKLWFDELTPRYIPFLLNISLTVDGSLWWGITKSADMVSFPLE